MTTIAIDEKACRGCELCVDTCPTGVFGFDQKTRRPTPDHAKECFGCLSCTEICPATAIEHEGVPRSESYYHDPSALAFASKLGTRSGPVFLVPTDAASQRKALDDLAARLVSVADVFKQTMGTGVAAVGLLAGRTLAVHLPRYRMPETLDAVLEQAREDLAPAWKLEIVPKGEHVTIQVADCFVRDVCARNRIELGQELCVLFYNYLVGYVMRLSKRRLRLESAERGTSRCVYEVAVQA